MVRAATAPTTPPRLVQLGRRTEVPPELACPEPKPACELIAPAIATPEPCVFQSVWGQVDFAILMFDLSRPERRLMWHNDAATALLESLAPHLQSRELLPLLVPEPDKLGCGPRTQRLLELRLGPVVLGYSIYRTSESHLVVLLRDITEQLRMTSIAESANLMENIGYVFGGIRHELGNPINTIKMTLSVMQRQLLELSAAQLADYLQRVLEEVSRVEYLLTTLKGFTLYETPELREVSLASVLERFAHIISLDLRRRAISLEMPALDPALTVLIDTRCLHQVLLNLVTNAADALHGRPHPRIVIAARAHTNQVELSVADNGLGIPVAQQQHLFHPFWTTKPHGTGLGLVIVKKMLTSMGASIEITSEESLGTTVTLQLQRAATAEELGRPGAAQEPSR